MRKGGSLARGVGSEYAEESAVVVPFDLPTAVLVVVVVILLSLLVTPLLPLPRPCNSNSRVLRAVVAGLKKAVVQETRQQARRRSWEEAGGLSMIKARPVDARLRGGGTFGMRT